MCDSTTTNPELTLTDANASTCGCGCGCSSDSAAETAVDSAGTSFALEGLSCGSCVAKVEKLLGGIDGVDSATVALVSGGTSTLTVAGDVSPELVLSAVTAAGYPATIASS